MAEPRAFMTITLFSTNLSGSCPGSGEIVTVPNLIFAATRLMDMVFVAVELAVSVTISSPLMKSPFVSGDWVSRSITLPASANQL